MKKLITLIAGLLLVALPVGLAGCDDSDKEIYNDGRLVTDVVIPTSMTVYRGMEVSVSGYGFAQGDAIALRAGEDLPAATTVASEKLLTFVIPDGAADQTVYKVVLNRAQDYQVLGSSRMTVQLAIDVDLGKTISGNWGGDAVIRGRGFMATDKLFLEQGGGKFEAPVKGADDSSLTFTIPQNAADGDCEFTLQRGAEEQALGSAKLNLSLGGVTVPDKEGATIKGIVHLAGQGIADVLVSDGDLITKTDANGFYWLNSEKRNELAFVILPAGYDVPTVKAMPQFWQPCTLDANTVEQLDFQLLRADNDSHTMLVATDMHLANRNSPKDYVQFADGFVKELTSAYNSAAPGKVYCLNLGDFSWDGYWYDNKWALPECKQSVEDFNFQMWSVMGNHDNDPYVASDFGAEGPYRQHMGPVYYAMNIGRIHYIMLDNTEYLNTGGSQGTVGFAQLQPPLRRPAAGMAQGGTHPCRQIDPDRRGMPLPALLVQRKRRRERSAPDPGRHRQNPELLRRLQQRDFPHGAHAREPQYPVADLCERLRAEYRGGLRHLVVDAAVRQQQRLHRRFARGLQDLHGRRNRPQMAVQSHGASHRKAVHHLRHERGQGVLGHRRHGTQGLRRRQRPPKPRQGLFDGGRKCRLHQRLGL